MMEKRYQSWGRYPAAESEALKLYWRDDSVPLDIIGTRSFLPGSEKYMPADMKTAPEVNIPAEFKDKGKFFLACPPDVQKIYTRIWTDLQK